MTQEAQSRFAKPFTKAWFGKISRLGRGDLGTQAAVLLSVLAIAGLTAWMMLSAPTSARSQASDEAGAKAMLIAPQEVALNNDAPAPTDIAKPAPSEPSAPQQAALVRPPAVNGLKILAQSWRRGGLGSNALMTFTLRNDNDYAVKNIAIACAFSRGDGSHLTDRQRLIPEAVVNRKSRKTFAQMHVGFVNINAIKAKCAPVAANGI